MVRLLAVCLLASLSSAPAQAVVIRGAIVPHEAVVLVDSESTEGNRVYTATGRGTLIDRDVVLSCAHGVTDKNFVRIGGRRVRATVIAIDPAADLAAFRIPPQDAEPVKVASPEGYSGELTVTDKSRFFRGRFRQWIPKGDDTPLSLEIQGRVDEGASGGGVFDARGRLVGVVWGGDDGGVYVTSGPPLLKFLRRALGERYTVVVVE